jgi:hypothetical protein
VPDVPYNGIASLERSRSWLPKLRQQFPTIKWAVAVQDGMDESALDGFDAVFVAGSTEWKWKTAASWVTMGHARGMWVHVARVNTRRKIEYCQDIGADSADGTGIFRGDKTQLRGVLEALTQPSLFR